MRNGSSDLLMTYLRVSQHMSRLFREHFGRLHLTFPQALVLSVLGEEGPLPISALAERTGSANSTVSGIVDRLEKLELARRERSGLDRRVILVAATEQYETLRQRAVTDVGGYFSSVLATLSQEERAMVAQALSKLDEALLAKEQEGTAAG
ncbi:MarR family transcriptional regulator [uncultured Intestinimonas sp.]|uniref:MarR family winged helix-turn-helix transcriptional regulator n=1 Tax=uncultured Intestinimonas sp. TaxID=1689265 RepID=UPI0025DF7C88|nr:MarR family transcriptional regulator [uncultured Intestinimonas sp.]